MGKVKTLEDLRKLRDELKSKTTLRDRSENPEEVVQVKVAMATCCIASGSRETINYLADELQKRNIEAIVTQTGCMGYCYAEPTVEVTVPGSSPIVFGYVTPKKADQIIECYIKNGELVTDLIPVTYQTIKNHD